jgi:hypothetical protein
VSGVGLLVVAASHYMGVARLVARSLFGKRHRSGRGMLSVYFAQGLFAVPRDATGKIVCVNCHLQAAPVEFSSPQ